MTKRTDERTMHELFELLEVPPGGLDRLRKKLDQESREKPRHWVRWLAPASIAAIAAASLILVNTSADDEPFKRLVENASHLELVRYGMQAPPPPGVTIPTEHRTQQAILPVVNSEQVEFYWLVAR